MQDYIENSGWLKFLVGFNILMFVIYMFVGSSGIFDDVLVYGVFNANAVKEGMYWLVLTSNFIHFEIWHAALNLIALYQIGSIIKQFYSEKSIFIVYIISGIASGLFTLLFSYSFGNIASLGASGSIFGLLGFLISGIMQKNRYGYQLPFTKESFYPTLIFAVIISLIPGVNWMAHLGGFVAGFGLGFVLENDTTNKVLRLGDRKLELLFRGSLVIFVISYVLLITNLLFDIVKIS